MYNKLHTIRMVKKSIMDQEEEYSILLILIEKDISSKIITKSILL